VYDITKSFPKEELFGLSNQFRRASSSISCNIAEGCGYRTNREFRRYLYIALGSAFESENILSISIDLGFIEEKKIDYLTNEIKQVKKMLYALIAKLKT
jgi:four helix bundle protein